MLTINKARFKNFCQHKDTTFNFEPGLVGIVGRNGCGKSNLIKGVLRALVGETFNPGKKEDDVSWSTDAVDDAFIELNFTTNGEPWQLKRSLKSSTVTMFPLSNPKDKTRSANEVKAKLFPMLNVHPRILTEIVFVLQGAIEGIIFQIPSERAKSLQHLFQTNNAERLRELFHDELNQVSLQSREAAIVELEIRLKKSVLEPLDAAHKTISEFRVGMLTEDAILKFKEVRSTYERAKTTNSQLERFKTELQASELVAVRTSSDLVRLEASLASQKKLIEETSPHLDGAMNLLQAANIVKSQLAHQTMLDNMIQSCHQTLHTPEPTLTLSMEQVDKECAALNTADTELRQLVKMVEEFNATKSANCPLCGQVVPQTYLAQRLQRRDELQKFISENTTLTLQRKATAKSMLDAHAYWQLKVTKANQDLKQLTDQRNALGPAAVIPEKALKDAQELVAAYDEFRTAYRRLESDVNSERNVLVMAKRHAESWAQQLKAAEQQVGAVVDEAAYTFAGEILAKHDQASFAVAKASGVIQTLEAQQADLEQQINKYREEEKKLVNQKRWKEWLERGKKILHRDELPALVMRAYLEALNRKLAMYLEIFGSKFSAKLLPDTSVRCQFASDSARQDVPSERLSGGQKVVLGIAFRFAVYDLFVKDLGLLVLDEPTVYLDKDNIRGVADLLERVKLYSKKSGMQLFVVTHEEDLISSFDQTIVLK